MSSTTTQTPTQGHEHDERSAYDLRPAGSESRPERRGFWRAFSEAVKGSRYHVRSL